MQQFKQPFVQLNDLSGRPLDNGNLYFGTANLNPEANPIVVYWDAAGTQPAVQPIKTQNGYCVRDGNVSDIYISQNLYSLTAKDKRGNLVFYKPTVDNDASIINVSGGGGLWTTVQDFINYIVSSVGSSVIGFIQAGVGAVARKLQDKNREIVSITDFGGDPTGATLCNAALDAAKLVSNTIYFPKGIFKIENYNLQDLRLVGAGSTGANYGVFNTIIEGSGNIFVNANNFSLQDLTIRNSAAGAPGILLQIKDIDTGIGPIENCNFLKANYHIYHSSATRTIVGAAIRGCLFREALIYSRYYANQGLFQYSEIDCYTQQNKRGLFIASTSSALLSASVFEFQDEGAIYVVNSAVAADVIKGLKFENIHFEQNGNVTPSADVTINVTLSLSRIEFDCCGFYASTLAGNVDLNGSADARIFEHECVGISYNNVGNAKIVQVNNKSVGATDGLRVSGADVRLLGGSFIANKGFIAQQTIYTRIFNVATATAVPAPPASYAALVLVRDSTTSGVAILMMTDTAVTVVSSTLTLITFTISGGFLNGQTTGGASFRDLFFNYMQT